MEALGILFLAMLVEGTVNYLAGDSEATRPYLRYITLALGIGAAVAYRVDIPAMVGLIGMWPWVNYAISGIIIGRGSNYTHDILEWVRSR